MIKHQEDELQTNTKKWNIEKENYQIDNTENKKNIGEL